MFRVMRADKDTYITDKVIKKKRKTESNVGGAGSLDLFKLFGNYYSGSLPQTELSRILIHFDLQQLTKLFEDGKIDPGDPSFFCTLRLHDVYGGQTTPSNFSVSVFPLSSSFEEGNGRDSSYFSDNDVCNWNSSSIGKIWHLPGCNMSGSASTICDYITSTPTIEDAESKAFFKSGEEDLIVDVTKIVSATITKEIPDCGLRISFSTSYENDSSTYFVKRFASRTAYDESKRPILFAGYDDSLSDDTQNLTFDSHQTVTLYNYVGGNLGNIVSGSLKTPVVGENCLILKLSTEVSGGTYDLFFTGSQNTRSFVSGVYQANIFIDSYEQAIASKLMSSSFIHFDAKWTSLDEEVIYATRSKLSIKKNDSDNSKLQQDNYVVNVSGISDEHTREEDVTVRVNLFDQNRPLVTLAKLPVETAGIVSREAYYQIRDVVSNNIVAPFDYDKGSTRLSCDSSGMFFSFNTFCLLPGRSYVIDIMLYKNGVKKKYLNASSIFRVV